MRSTAITLVALAGLLAACAASPSRVQQDIEEMKPRAAEAAKERAQSDLACIGVQTEILEHDAGDIGKAYGLSRVEYTVRAAGCGRSSIYRVACTPRSVCSAMADSGLVERQ
ncbi:MAG: hypothetical protein IT532_06030 [Burkholderiales bacterium]|nr:hypothetical protein [Burkholderiales bacterium]